MSACLIHDVEIHEPGPYGKFMEQVKPLVEAFGGRCLVRGGPHEVLEGRREPTRLVLFEFPDMDTARKLFASDEHAPLKQLRQSCSSGNVVIVQGL